MLLHRVFKLILQQVRDQREKREFVDMKLGSSKIIIAFPKLSIWISLISITLMTSGCYEDLSKVQQFSKVAATIKETSDRMGKDIYESCIRRETRKNETEKIQKTFASQTTSYQTQFQPSPSSLNNRRSISGELGEIQKLVRTTEEIPYTFAPIRMDERCDRFKPVAQSAIQANLLLVNYLESLGQLASDQQVTLNQNLTDLGSTITNLNPTFKQANISISINQDYVKAGESIVGLLVDKFFTKPFQRESLKSIMVCQDKNFGKYTSLLNTIAKDFYLDILWKEEKGILYAYFEERSLQAPIRYANSMQDFSNEIQTITQQYIKDKVQLNELKDRAEAYIELMSLTTQNHHKLAMILGNNMNEKEIQSFCPQNVSPKTSEISQNLEPPSKEQLKEVDKVLDNYLKETKPLVDKLNR
jgi:hypothetical protein